MSAMAYVIITGDLHDRDFIARCCSGFDGTQMPDGCQDEESYRDYILGSRDGQPKTPEWAEAICGVPREDIARIAREYATAEAAVLYQGYGMQRRAYGEQVVRGGCVLAAITGNVGNAGGWASGIALQAGGDFGQVVEVHVEESDPVRKGDLVITLDPKSYQAQVDQASARVRMQFIAIERQRLLIDNLEERVERQESMFEKKLVDEDSFERLQNELSLARVDLRSYQESLSQAQAALNQADMKVYRKRMETVIARLGHLR